MAFFQSQFMNVLYVVFGVALMVPMQLYGVITKEETVSTSPFLFLSYIDT